MAPDRELVIGDIPSDVAGVLQTLGAAGHEAVLVGGCVRDSLLGVAIADWDAATSARPQEVAELFGQATWENRFGTVTVHGTPDVEVTSYRAESAYRDLRRPDDVRFGVSLADDLARRDFTINAMAWLPLDLPHGRGRLIDSFDGQADLDARILRAVGDPRQRFAEDALRLVRAARLAGRFDLDIEPATRAAIVEMAPGAASVSGERLGDELLRMLGDPVPSRAVGWLERLGLLVVILPELAALRGVAQHKRVAGDALDHTLRAVDVAPPDGPRDLRLATLLHDLGKATTGRDGHFLGHAAVGAGLAGDVLRRLRFGRERADRIIAVIEHHMYDYRPEWTDAAVRRFIRRTHRTDRELLFALRRADAVGSGEAHGVADAWQAEIESRVAAELAGQPELLMHRRLAIDGDDLQRELGLEPGPQIGALLERLTELVLDDPTRNERTTLLELARAR